MNSTTYSHISQAWQFIEETSLDNQTPASRHLYDNALASHAHTIISTSQADFLRVQARLVSARTVLVIGTETGLEIPALVSGMNNEGQLTVVTSSPEAAASTREIFNNLPETRTKMRCVNTEASAFLKRLNAHDYDMIIVSDEAANYRAALDEAERLLRSDGVLILTDAMAMTSADAQGGVANAVDRSAKAVALREVIAELSDNESFDTALVSIGTGIIIAVAR